MALRYNVTYSKLPTYSHFVSFILTKNNELYGFDVDNNSLTIRFGDRNQYFYLFLNCLI